MDWPLALCDSNSVRAENFIEFDNVRKHYTGSTMYVFHSPAMNWYSAATKCMTLGSVWEAWSAGDNKLFTARQK